MRSRGVPRAPGGPVRDELAARVMARELLGPRQVSSSPLLKRGVAMVHLKTVAFDRAFPASPAISLAVSSNSEGWGNVRL